MTDTVTLDRVEYEALLADRAMLRDMAAYDAAMADFVPDDAIPHDAVKRLLDGENPLTVFRQARGFSVSALARHTGVNRVQIHDIESGRSNGSAMTLHLLARHLRVSIEDLLPEAT